MRILAKKTKEGIPLRDYHLGALAVALLPGFFLALIIRLLAMTVRETKVTPKDPPPANTLFVVFHPEMLTCMVARKFWLENCLQMNYLGTHTFASYVTSVICYLDGLQAMRFDRQRSDVRPIDQIRAFLRTNAQRAFAFRTDSGRPYNHVRASAAGLAISTDRPIVCMRQTVDKAILINEHFVPLPFARITTYLSEPITAAQLAAMSNAEATAYLQAEMERLAPIR